MHLVAPVSLMRKEYYWDSNSTKKDDSLCAFKTEEIRLISRVTFPLFPQQSARSEVKPRT